MKNIKAAIQLIAAHLQSCSVKKAISYQLQRDDVMTEFEFRSSIRPFAVANKNKNKQNKGQNYEDNQEPQSTRPCAYR